MIQFGANVVSSPQGGATASSLLPHALAPQPLARCWPLFANLRRPLNGSELRFRRLGERRIHGAGGDPWRAPCREGSLARPLQGERIHRSHEERSRHPALSRHRGIRRPKFGCLVFYIGDATDPRYRLAQKWLLAGFYCSSCCQACVWWFQRSRAPHESLLQRTILTVLPSASAAAKLLCGS